MGLSKKQVGIGLQGLGGILQTAGEIHERKRLEKKRDDEIAAEKADRTKREEKLDTRYFAEVEAQQRADEQRAKEHRTQTDLAIRNAADDAEVKTRNEKAKAQKDANDPDTRFNGWLQGTVKPATPEEERWFQGKLAEQENKATPKNTGRGKSGERMSNAELYKEWQKQKNDKTNQIFGTPQSFKDFVNEYHNTLDALEGITAPGGAPGAGGQGGGARTPIAGVQGGQEFSRPNQGQVGTTGNPAIDLYNQRIADRAFEESARLGSVAGGPGTPGGRLSDTVGAGIMPQDTAGIGPEANPADFLPAEEPGAGGIGDGWNNFDIPTLAHPGYKLTKKYPDIPLPVLDYAAQLPGFDDLSTNDRELVIQELMQQAIESGILQAQQ